MQEIKRRNTTKRNPFQMALYGVTGVLLVILVVLLVLFMGDNAGERHSEDMYSSEDGAGTPSNVFEENSYPEVSSLVSEYFKACAENDQELLNQLVSDMSEDEKKLIERKNQYVEGYENVKSYVKLGPIEDSYLVFATYGMKFSGLDVAVPGLETLYVRTDGTGKLYIYKGKIEAEVSSYVSDAVQSKDAVKIINQVNDDYLNTLADNEDVLEFVEKFEGESELVAQAKELAKTKSSEEAKAKEEAEAKAKAEAEAKAKAEAEQAAQQAASNGQETDESVTLIQTVNVRQSNSETSEKIAHLFVGDVVTRVKITEDGWSQIRFNGDSYGYVKTEYVSKFQMTADKVKPTTVVNVRSECSETANIIGQLDVDSTYTRNVTYENGWSQISMDGKVGYVKSEYLTK